MGGQREGFSCLAQSWFDISTSGQQTPFGSRITHTPPNRNNVAIYGSTKAFKSTDEAESWDLTLLFSQSWMQQSGRMGEKHSGNRGKKMCSEEVKPEGTRRPLKHQKLISVDLKGLHLLIRKDLSTPLNQLSED